MGHRRVLGAARHRDLQADAVGVVEEDAAGRGALGMGDDTVVGVTTAPDRVRACAHDACVLRFFDTSRNGTRHWCSMAACGNRAKASRHYARTKTD